MELLVDIQEDHAELEMVENNDLDLLIPAGWAGGYYPLYIPDGFTVTDVGSLFASVNFASSDGRNIRFTELTPDDQAISTVKMRACPIPQSTARTLSSSEGRFYNRRMGSG